MAEEAVKIGIVLLFLLAIFAYADVAILTQLAGEFGVNKRVYSAAAYSTGPALPVIAKGPVFFNPGVSNTTNIVWHGSSYSLASGKWLYYIANASSGPAADHALAIGWASGPVVWCNITFYWVGTVAKYYYVMLITANETHAIEKSISGSSADGTTISISVEGNGLAICAIYLDRQGTSSYISSVSLSASEGPDLSGQNVWVNRAQYYTKSISQAVDLDGNPVETYFGVANYTHYFVVGPAYNITVVATSKTPFRSPPMVNTTKVCPPNVFIVPTYFKYGGPLPPKILACNSLSPSQYPTYYPADVEKYVPPSPYYIRNLYEPPIIIDFEDGLLPNLSNFTHCKFVLDRENPNDYTFKIIVDSEYYSNSGKFHCLQWPNLFIPLRPNWMYKFSTFMKTENVKYPAQMKYEFWNERGEVSYVALHTSNSLAPSSDWINFTSIAEASQGDIKLTIVLVGFVPADSSKQYGISWFDDLTIIPLADPPVYNAIIVGQVKIELRSPFRLAFIPDYGPPPVISTDQSGFVYDYVPAFLFPGKRVYVGRTSTISNPHCSLVIPRGANYSLAYYDELGEKRGELSTNATYLCYDDSPGYIVAGNTTAIPKLAQDVSQIYVGEMNASSTIEVSVTKDAEQYWFGLVYYGLKSSYWGKKTWVMGGSLHGLSSSATQIFNILYPSYLSKAPIELVFASSQSEYSFSSQLRQTFSIILGEIPAKVLAKSTKILWNPNSVPYQVPNVPPPSAIIAFPDKSTPLFLAIVGVVAAAFAAYVTSASLTLPAIAIFSVVVALYGLYVGDPSIVAFGLYAVMVALAYMAYIRKSFKIREED